jgi:tetratricopeptide (TPR) repeat protein|tara:strand:+ start:314 stop:760 length:447 start_codon:yes stop_codon:yes gene_type:complete
MNNTDIKFIEAVKLFNDGFYWDSIEAFQDSLSSGLEDRYVDDCFLNIAICYMKLNLFNESKENFLKAISASETSGDKIDFEGPIFGKTSDRAKLGLIRVSLANNDIDNAETLLANLKGSESYIEVNNEKIMMFDVASEEIAIAKKTFL